MEKTKYRISGKIDPQQLRDIPKKANLTAYVMCDRKLLGSAPVKKSGKFIIEYTYDTYSSEDRILPLGVQFTFAPHLPDGSIVSEKFRGSFLPANAFKEEQGMFYADASKEYIDAAFD